MDRRIERESEAAKLILSIHFLKETSEDGAGRNSFSPPSVWVSVDIYVTW